MPSKRAKPSGKGKRPLPSQSTTAKPKAKSVKPTSHANKSKSSAIQKKSTTKTKSAPKPAVMGKTGGAGKSLEGRRAPAFVLPDQDGTRVTLESLIAHGPVVLYFYPKDMTPGCTVEACSFRDNNDAIRALGATVVGVSADQVESHQKFIAKHSLNFPLLSDTENKVTKAYGVYTTKSLYGREFMGIVRTTVIIGKDGMVKKVFPKVKVNGHSEEVIAALKELS
jgi:peroxiredoxin